MSLAPRSSSASAVVIGLDVGSSGVRAVAVDAAGGELASSRVAHRDAALASHAGADLLGLDPAVILDEALAALRAVASRAMPATVRAIGVTAFRQTLVLHDRGRVLAAFGNTATVGREHVSDDRPFAASLAAPRLRWLAQHRAELFDPDTAAVATLSGWLAGILTGEFAETPTDASTSGLLDSAGGDWTGEARTLATSLGFVLPPTIAAGQPVGTVRSGLADELGLGSRSQVTLAGGDAQAAALVARMTEADATTLCCGTHWQQLTPGAAGSRTPARVTASHRPGETYRETVIYYPGETFAAVAAGRNDLAADPLASLAGQELHVFFRSTLEPAVPIDRGRPVFAWTTQPRDGWIDNLPPAVAIGASLTLDHVVRRAHDDSGAPRELVVVGGAARSRSWLEIIAAALDRPVTALPNVEAAALGAALLGWQTAGEDPTHAEQALRIRTVPVTAGAAVHDVVDGCRQEWAAARELLGHWDLNEGAKREARP